MKKLISLILTICLLLTLSASLFSCDRGDNDDDDKKRKPKPNDNQIKIHTPTKDELPKSDNDGQLISGTIPYAIIIFKENTSKNKIDNIIDKYGTVVGQIPQIDLYQIKLNDKKANADKICNEIMQKYSTNVFYAHSDYADILKGSYYTEFKDNTSADYSEDYRNFDKDWWLDIIQAESARNDLANAGCNTQDIKVGVLDAGVDANHKALNVTPLLSNVPHQHGTHVSGIIGGNTDCSIIPNCQIYSVDLNVVYENDDNKNETVVKFLSRRYMGLALLAIQGVKVINYSQGGKSPQSHDALSAMMYMLKLREKNYDCIIVAGAGNDGKFFEDGAEPHNSGPSDFAIIYTLSKQTADKYYVNLEEYLDKDIRDKIDGLTDSEIEDEIDKLIDSVANRIIVVGAMQFFLTKCKYGRALWLDENNNTTGSNYGHNIDIWAPGVDIYSTINSGSHVTTELWSENVDKKIDDRYDGTRDFGYMAGTSMATPIVTGIAAMVWAANTDLSGAEVKQIVCNTENKYNFKCDCSESCSEQYYVANADFAVREALFSDIYQRCDEYPNILVYNGDQKITNFTIKVTDQETKQETTYDVNISDTAIYFLSLTEGYYYIEIIDNNDKNNKCSKYIKIDKFCAIDYVEFNFQQS